MAPITTQRLLVCSLFLPYTISFQDKESRYPQSSHINPTVPKPNLIEGLAANRASTDTNRPPTPVSRHKDSDAKLFPEREKINPPSQSPSRARDHEISAETTWTVESCSLGNIGLQNAIHSISHKLTKVMWVGTLGIATDTLTEKTCNDIKSKLITDHDSIPVIVDDHHVFEGHYSQFCKQVLWPTFHYVLPDNPKSKVYEENLWKYYVALNQLFADTIVEHYQPGDIIWINDYHLLLVPNMVRQKHTEAMIGFFLHIPFPSSEIFRCLPERKEILEGVLGADLIGFQTYSFARHFIQTCSRLLSSETTPKGIQHENTFVAVGIFPIGIDINSLNEKRKDPEVAEWINLLKEKYAGKKLVVARDKLDYVKGVRQKMLAFERFLMTHQEWQEKVVLIQVALSTTEQNQLQGQVSDIVARINSKFSNLAYQPVVYLHQDITFSQYLALLSAADVCLITSLRDGMNLTSHEYVVCQEERHRPLILSEFAGTYGSFGAAIRINPWDYQETAEAIHEALVISDEEASARWKELYKHAATNTAQFWAETFVSELEKVHSDIQRRFSTHIPHLSPKSFLNEFKKAKQRLFLLGYDGTLAPYQKAPAGSHYAKDLVELLTHLTANPRNIVYVMSGRMPDDLDRRLGDVPNLGMSAENGAYLKTVNGKWENINTDLDMGWKEQVMEIFKYYTERTPGSSIEQKNVSLVFHYRGADNLSYGAWQAAECQNHIQEAIGNSYPIHAIAGNRNVEVMPKNVNQTVAVGRILQANEPEFILCIGDDRNLYEFLDRERPQAYTCAVGYSTRGSKYFISNVTSVRATLEILAEADD